MTVKQLTVKRIEVIMNYGQNNYDPAKDVNYSDLLKGSQ